MKNINVCAGLSIPGVILYQNEKIQICDGLQIPYIYLACCVWMSCHIGSRKILIQLMLLFKVMGKNG